MAVHEVTVARSGAGKTYARGAYFAVTEWLPFTHNGVFYTNLPLLLDEIIVYIQRYHPELVSSSAIERIHLFDGDRKSVV